MVSVDKKYASKGKMGVVLKVAYAGDLGLSYHVKFDNGDELHTTADILERVGNA